MIIEESFTVAAEPARVSDFLLDIDLVKDCVPGVRDVTQTGEDTYEAVLQIALGSIRPSFRGSIEVDTGQAPQHLAAHAKGRDRSTGSLAEIRFDAELNEATPRQTTVAVTADVTIRGKLGQFGTGVIRSTAQEVVRQFASCVNARVQGQVGAQASQPSAGRAVARGLWLYLTAAFRRLVGKLRSARSNSRSGGA